MATPAQERGADWSADGQALVFASNESGRYALYVVSRTGGRWGTPRRVSRDLIRASARRLRWSPDGRFIAYSDAGVIELISPAGGEPRKLVESQDLAAFENLAWSRDSRLVYYVGPDAQGEVGIWSVSLAGGPPRRLARFDDPATDFGRGNFGTTATRLYFALVKRESDIWTAEVLAR